MAIIYSDRARGRIPTPRPATPAVPSAAGFRAAEERTKVTPARGSRTTTKATVTPAVVDPTDVDISDFTVETNRWPKKGGTKPGAAAIESNKYKTQKDYAEAVRLGEQQKALRSFIEGTMEYVDEDTGEVTQVPLYQTPYYDLLESLKNYRADEEDALATQYQTAAQRLRDVYGVTPAEMISAREKGTPIDMDKWSATAQGQTYQSYEALKNWLANNAPTAYQQATRATPVNIDNALAAYQRAQGVSSAPVDAQIAAMNVAAGGGAANYNNLLNVLQAAERSQATSRAAEANLAQNLAGNRLNAALTAGLGGLTQQEAAALATIAQRYGQRGIDVETSASNRYNTLVDRLIQLAGYNDVADLLRGRRG